LNYFFEMTHWIEVADGFWNLRGSFHIGGLINIGTHMSLIKLNNGNFLVVDTIALDDISKTELDELTSNGTLIEAVVATHPFHTTFFPAFFALYPQPKYYGTPRHLLKTSGVNWAGSLADEGLRKTWESSGVFMQIPDGSEFVNPAEDNHFSSVVVFHQSSKTIHVDDTIMYFDNPGCILCCLGKRQGCMEFWDLKKGLGPRAEPRKLFKDWVGKILVEWDIENICTAHTGNKIGGAKDLLREALDASGL
jgi:hypothetical protein